VLNSAPIPEPLKRKYAKARVKPVENDFERLRKLGVKVVTADLLGQTAERKVRHDPEALAAVVIELASRSRAYQVRKDELTAQRRKYK
jgi:hypothetical protein